MLTCGCDPSLEGGYGDDGTQSRYSMEWCQLHAKAPEMRDFITWARKISNFPETDGAMDLGERLLSIEEAARVLLAEIGGES